MCKLQPRQHRHQGLRNEAGARSSPRGGSRLADSCGHPSAFESTGSSTRNRESAPGSPNPRGAHSHPDRVIGCRLLQMQELLRNATTPFSSHHHLLTPGQGVPRWRPASAPLTMGDGSCLAPEPVRPTTAPPNPFRPSTPAQSCHSSPPTYLLLPSIIPRGTLGSSATLWYGCRHPDDNIVEWEPFSCPTASWAMLSDASSTRSCASSPTASWSG